MQNNNRKAALARRQRTGAQSNRVELVATAHQPLQNMLVLSAITQVLALEATRPSFEKKALARQIVRKLDTIAAREYNELKNSLKADADTFEEVVNLLVAHNRATTIVNEGTHYRRTFIARRDARPSEVKAAISLYWDARRDSLATIRDYKKIEYITGTQIYAKNLPNARFPEFPEDVMYPAQEKVFLANFDWETYCETEIPDTHYSEMPTFGDSYAAALAADYRDAITPWSEDADIRATLFNRARVTKRHMALDKKILVNRQKKSGQGLRNTVRAAKRERNARMEKLGRAGIDVNKFLDAVDEIKKAEAAAKEDAAAQAYGVEPIPGCRPEYAHLSDETLRSMLQDAISTDYQAIEDELTTREEWDANVA